MKAAAEEKKKIEAEAEEMKIEAIKKTEIARIATEQHLLRLA